MVWWEECSISNLDPKGLLNIRRSCLSSIKPIQGLACASNIRETTILSLAGCHRRIHAIDLDLGPLASDLVEKYQHFSGDINDVPKFHHRLFIFFSTFFAFPISIYLIFLVSCKLYHIWSIKITMIARWSNK